MITRDEGGSGGDDDDGDGGDGDDDEFIHDLQSTSKLSQGKLGFVPFDISPSPWLSL